MREKIHHAGDDTMKLKILTLTLSVLLLLCALAGCTLKDPEHTESYSLPSPESGQQRQTEALNSTSAQPEPEQSVPTGSSEGDKTTDTASPGTETLPAPEDVDPEGMEVESGFTVVVDDGLGIGGN